MKYGYGNIPYCSKHLKSIPKLIANFYHCLECEKDSKVVDEYVNKPIENKILEKKNLTSCVKMGKDL